MLISHTTFTHPSFQFASVSTPVRVYLTTSTSHSRCIYDRKVSGLPCLSSALSSSLDEQAYSRLVADYVHHLSIIADDSINCGPALNWLQMDNKGLSYFIIVLASCSVFQTL